MVTPWNNVFSSVLYRLADSKTDNVSSDIFVSRGNQYIHSFDILIYWKPVFFPQNKKQTNSFDRINCQLTWQKKW